MSYYDWVKSIESLKDSPMDDSLIEKLKTQKIENNHYTIARLVIHIYNMIEERLNKAGFVCLKGIINNHRDINALELHFINLKKEKQFVSRLNDLQIFDNETKEKIRKRINLKFKEIYNFLKIRVNELDIDGIYISTFEKILSSSMEE